MAEFNMVNGILLTGNLVIWSPCVCAEGKALYGAGWGL